MSGEGRRCPLCGARTEELVCPEDGTSTLLAGVRPKHPSELTAGTVVAGRYRLERVLGGGGFAVVYAAKHLLMGHEVAVKILTISSEEGEERVLLRFFQEARVTASLKHPNTVRVFDVGQDDNGVIFIAMELLAGQTLGALLRARKRDAQPFSEREIVDILTPVAKSLTEAHALGLVHRDLKPDNVMLHEVIGDDPVVKVVDFGIAKLRDTSLTGTAQSPLTPEYASPEQARGQAVDARSDLYTLGVIMYQLACFEVPFRGQNPLATLFMHTEKAPPSLSAKRRSLSPSFVELVEALLAKDPADRPANATHFRELLDRVKNGQPLALGSSRQSHATPVASAFDLTAPEPPAEVTHTEVSLPAGGQTWARDAEGSATFVDDPAARKASEETLPADDDADEQGEATTADRPTPRVGVQTVLSRTPTSTRRLESSRDPIRPPSPAKTPGALLGLAFLALLALTLVGVFTWRGGEAAIIEAKIDPPPPVAPSSTELKVANEVPEPIVEPPPSTPARPPRPVETPIAEKKAPAKVRTKVAPTKKPSALDVEL